MSRAPKGALAKFAVHCCPLAGAFLSGGLVRRSVFFPAIPSSFICAVSHVSRTQPSNEIVSCQHAVPVREVVTMFRTRRALRCGIVAGLVCCAGALLGSARALHAVDVVDNPPPAEGNKAADFFRLAVESMRLQDYEGAVKWCGEAIELDGQNAKFYLLRACAKGALNDNNGVLEDCSRVIKLDPKNGKAFGMRGFAKLYADDPKSAIRDFAAAIRLDAKNGDWYRGRGRAYAAADDLKNALADYDKSLKLQPADLGTLRLRVSARRKLDDLEGARDDIEKVIRADPDDREAKGLHREITNAISEKEMAAAKRSWVKLRQDQAPQMVRRILGEPSWITGNRWWYSYEFANQPGWVDFGGRSGRVEQFREPAWTSGGFKRGQKPGEQ